VLPIAFSPAVRLKPPPRRSEKAIGNTVPAYKALAISVAARMPLVRAPSAVGPIR
jgi:hypothetical protein